MLQTVDGTLTGQSLARCPEFRLGSVEVNPGIRTISGPKGVAQVEPRVMQVLIALAEGAGRVVSRDTLFSRCWGDVHVGEDSLNRVIRELRRVGQQVAGDGLVVETIPRTGYRLRTAEAEPVDDAAKPLGAPAATGRIDRTRIAMLVGGVALTTGLPFLWRGVSASGDSKVEAFLSQADQVARNGLPDSQAQGVGMLKQAVALDPDNARAWGKLALAWTVAAEYAPPDQAAAATLAVQDAARRAIALDRGQADAHSALALLVPYYGDWFEARRRFQTVLALAPDHLPTLDAFAFFNVGTGLARESAEARLDFSRREPLSAHHLFRLAYAYWILGKVAEADRTADRGLQLWPRHPGLWFQKLFNLVFTGRTSRALVHVDDAAGRPDMPPQDLATNRSILTALLSGRPADGGRAVDAIMASLARGPSQSIMAMPYLFALGADDRAFDVARAYYLERGPIIAELRWRPGALSVNDQRRRKTQVLFAPMSVPMRADPRFLPLVEDMGLMDYWRRADLTPDFLRG